MSYQIGYIDIFKPLIPEIPVVLVIGISLLFLLYKENKENIKHAKIGLLIFTVTVSSVTILLASQVGSGWTLEGNNLRVKAFETRNIQLSETEIDLVDIKGQWQLGRKRVGYNSGDLHFGFFYLKNEKSAIVFQHLASPKMLVILFNNEYIVLSHPGIENLYNELLSRGVLSRPQ